jgi:uncharacterized protein
VAFCFLLFLVLKTALMPVLSASDYRPPLLLKNRHFNTVFAALFRRVSGIAYRRERIELPDGDFLDLDWAGEGRSERLVLALHGMEGNSERQYISGMLRAFVREGWDGAALNFRGCSGTPNRLPRAYHMGDTGDLDFIINQLRGLNRYTEIALIGFSLGGNVILKYLGEQGGSLAPEIKKAVVFSVPCHISSSEREISKLHNRPYVKRFLSTLNPKMQYKATLFPDVIDARPPLPRNLREFDDRFTAPLHGFADAEDYWERSSSLQFIPNISIPALMVNALDDSFLSPECYPRELANELPNFFLETPQRGGHVGFVTFGVGGMYWSEQRALAFCNK